MVGTLLVRGMLVGLLAGILAFAFAWWFGEPLIDRAIAFEDHLHQMAGDPPEPELVSRAVQSTIGLLTGFVVYSCAIGGLFSLAFAYAQGRLGRLSPRATAAVLAGLAFVVLVLVPQIKYPANPPSIGEPETIRARTALYFGMIAWSLAACVAAFRAVRRLAGWNAALAGGAIYVLAVAVAMQVLPKVDEVPAEFSAALLWQFRIAALGGQVVLWGTLGLAFGYWVEREQKGRMFFFEKKNQKTFIT